MALENFLLAGIELGNRSIGLMDKLLGPMVTRRQADADAYAEVEQALARRIADYIDLSPGSLDVAEALISCGGKTGLTNLARIVQRAAGQLNEDADPSQIDDDWAANYKDKARTCSNEEMADLWAQLLAAEANNPGSYSKKTVNVLADLEPDDARLFRDTADFRLIPHNPIFGEGRQVHGFSRPPSVKPRLVVLDDIHSIYTDRGVNFESLARLEWLGLLRYVTPGYTLTQRGNSFNSYLNGDRLIFLSQDGPIRVGRAEFTPAGSQLSDLCIPHESPKGFLDYLADTWRGQGIKVAFSLKELASIPSHSES